MDNYIVSARKYRPTTFESVVGQQNITQTLRNAIRSNHLAQAYLFCGPRGVGKTTCARIFAKTINCLNPTEEHDACNECESCVAFNEQRSFNIHELDAASNNSVQDIRDLIDQVRIPPQIGRYSVYIIDEVHMLSKDAFNALLKTLEEPPSYAVFILATTEKHKVIPTILSRCQVFDFSRITVADTIRHLQYVAKQEGITATEEALNVVAQKADGGMRDALSIFDQLVSFCGNNITYEQAIEVLNVLDTEYYFRLVDCALQGDVSQALLLFNNVLNKGFDALNFVVGLGSHLRDVLVSKDAVTVKLLETSENIKKHYAEQASRCAAPFLFSALQIVNDCELRYREAKNKRLTVEIMLIRLCQLATPQPTAQQAATPNLKPQAAPARTTPTTSAAPTTPSAPTAQTRPTAPTVPNIPTPQRSQAPQGSRPASVSIHTGMKSQTAQTSQTTQTTPTTQNTPLRDTPFSREAFDEAWLTLPRIISDDRLKATLMNAQARVENNNILLTLSNSLQEQEVMRVKKQILSEMADKLQNDRLTLQTQVVERKQTEGFTSQEKYKFLIKKNNALEELAQEMKLQLE